MRLPNIILFMTDQHRADHLGCYGNRHVRTPNIDAIAARGVAFDRFYVASPICMPNRSTLMTGRMPSLHGVRHNGIGLRLDDATFVEALRRRGYATALVGKSHLQNMQDEPPMVKPARHAERVTVEGLETATADRRDGAAYEQELYSRWRDPAHRLRLPYYGFEHVELCMEHGDMAFGDYERWLKARLPNADSLRGPAMAGRGGVAAPQAWRTGLPEALYPSSYIAERSVAYLTEHAAARRDQPFFLMCSFPDPHHPFTPPGRYWDMYDPAQVPVPATCAAPPDSAPAHLRWLHEERASGKANLGTPRVVAVTEREAREAIALTYGMITMIDDRIGEVMRALRDSGLDGETIVIFTSDHGDFMGDHGLLFKGPLHYQGLVRVPFIWAEPGGGTPRRSTALHSTLDIAQSLLARTGTAPYHDIQGESLRPSLEGGATISGHGAVLIEDEIQRVFGGFDQPVRLRTLITDRWRVTHYLGADWGELYDLQKDPEETSNLWAEPAHAATRAELGEQLIQKMMAVASRSPLPTRIA